MSELFDKALEDIKSRKWKPQSFSISSETYETTLVSECGTCEWHQDNYSFWIEGEAGSFTRDDIRMMLDRCWDKNSDIIVYSGEFKVKSKILQMELVPGDTHFPTLISTIYAIVNPRGRDESKSCSKMLECIST